MMYFPWSNLNPWLYWIQIDSVFCHEEDVGSLVNSFD